MLSYGCERSNSLSVLRSWRWGRWSRKKPKGSEDTSKAGKEEPQKSDGGEETNQDGTADGGDQIAGQQSAEASTYVLADLFPMQLHSGLCTRGRAQFVYIS